MNILHIVGSLDVGGVEKWLLSLCENQHKNNIYILCNSSRDEEFKLENRFRDSGCIIIKTKFSNNFIKDFFKFKNIILSKNIQVVHAHQHTYNGIYMLYASILKVKKRISHMHSMRSEKRPHRILYKNIMLYLIKRFSTNLIVVSKQVGDYFFKNEKTKVIHCGFDLTNIDKFKEIYSSEKKLIQIGRLVPEKNFLFSLDVFYELLKINKEYEFYIIGDGPDKNRIINKINALGLEKNVHLLGYREDVIDLLNSHKGIVLFPSLWEGLGLVAIEAQISGRQCLSSNNVPIETNIGGNTFLKGYDVSQWLYEIIKISNNKSRLNENLSNFDILTNISDLEKIYECFD